MDADLYRPGEATMTVNTGLMTADELWQLPDDGMRHELVRGELRTMPPTGLEHSDQQSVLDTSLGVYVRKHGLGRIFVGDPGFLLSSNPDTVRAPDLAFIRRDRLTEPRGRRGFFHGAPDLAVEVIPPNDLYTEVDEKVAEWLVYGAALMFVVNPRRQTAAVHRPGQPIRVLTVDDEMCGEDVVPGWSQSVRELFEQD